MRPDARTLGLVTALLAGGWVCRGADQNPCLGATTCAVDVATACCPLDEPLLCGNACAPTSDIAACSSGITCEDDNKLLACTFSATIDSATCTGPVASGSGAQWTIDASGTVSGCGDEVVFVTDFDGTRYDSVGCGTWQPGVLGGCVPHVPDVTTTTWSVHQVVSLPAGTTRSYLFKLVRGHGADRLILSGSQAMEATCGP